jgi:thiosulfate/3-mercaptopyruvate sulfurtransferase
MTSQNLPLLVETSWLAENIDDPKLRIFDCTTTMGMGAPNQGKQTHYDKHHIKGASYLDLASPEGLLCDFSSSRPYAWPQLVQIEQALSNAGVTQDSKVVLYADLATNAGPGSAFWATRAWLILHQVGVDCAILNGGWQKWLAEGLPIESTEHSYETTSFKAAFYREDVIASKEDVIEILENNNTLLVDGLNEASYLGKEERPYAPRNGHISGAVNIPYSSLIDQETGCFVKPELIREMLAANGWGEGKEHIVSYCGGGVAATLNTFVFKLAGIESASLYAPGLSEWANDPSLPMSSPYTDDA